MMLGEDNPFADEIFREYYEKNTKFAKKFRRSYRTLIIGSFVSALTILATLTYATSKGIYDFITYKNTSSKLETLADKGGVQGLSEIETEKMYEMAGVPDDPSKYKLTQKDINLGLANYQKTQ